jgi:hypothetical protein
VGSFVGDVLADEAVAGSPESALHWPSNREWTNGAFIEATFQATPPRCATAQLPMGRHDFFGGMQCSLACPRTSSGYHLNRVNTYVVSLRQDAGIATFSVVAWLVFQANAFNVGYRKLSLWIDFSDRAVTSLPLDSVAHVVEVRSRQ